MTLKRDNWTNEELNRLAAESVMGWECKHTCYSCDGVATNYSPIRNPPTEWGEFVFWNPTELNDHAIMLFIKIKEIYGLDIQWIKNGWSANVYRLKGDGIIREHFDLSLPAAITRAILKAEGVLP